MARMGDKGRKWLFAPQRDSLRSLVDLRDIRQSLRCTWSPVDKLI